MQPVDDHDCKPPMEDRPISEPTICECPDCHDLWEVRPRGAIDPSQSYSFNPGGWGQNVTPAEWVRVGPANS